MFTEHRSVCLELLRIAFLVVPNPLGLAKAGK